MPNRKWRLRIAKQRAPVEHMNQKEQEILGSLSRSSFSNANEGITLSGDANVPAPVDTAVAVKTSVFFFLLFFTFTQVDF